MAWNDSSLSRCPSTEPFATQSPLPSPPHSLLSISTMDELQESASVTLGPQPIIISLDNDDAIARHEHYDHNNGIDKQDSPQYTPKVTSRIRSISSPVISQFHPAPPSPQRANSCCALDGACESHWDYGPTALAEDEAALEYSAELAAKAASKKLKRGSVTSAAGEGEAAAGEAGVEAGAGVDLSAAFKEEEEVIEEEEEEDNCLSGVCVPKSQFFQTSIICSNAMTRDCLANERTFLAWMSTCNALCLVSFSFITRSLTLETVSEIQNGSPRKHVDRLPKAIGWVCFFAAFFASIFSLLKYLRNIRRISTRYPFARAGKWTFTIGMSLGILIMAALVIANTTRL